MVTVIVPPEKATLLMALKFGMAVGVLVTKLYSLGLPVVVVYGMIKLVAVVRTASIYPKVMLGVSTVPVAATLLVAAPVLVRLTLPFDGLEVVAAIRT